MKNIKKLPFLIICIFIAISTFSVVKASSDLYLNNLEFDVQINSDGSMDVVETWDIDIEDTNTLFKTFKKDSEKYTSISNGKVSKINSSGEEIDFRNSKICFWLYPLFINCSF